MRKITLITAFLLIGHTALHSQSFNPCGCDNRIELYDIAYNFIASDSLYEDKTLEVSIYLQNFNVMVYYYHLRDSGRYDLAEKLQKYHKRLLDITSDLVKRRGFKLDSDLVEYVESCGMPFFELEKFNQLGTEAEYIIEFSPIIDNVLRAEVYLKAHFLRQRAFTRAYAYLFCFDEHGNLIYHCRSLVHYG